MNSEHSTKNDDKHQAAVVVKRRKTGIILAFIVIIGIVIALIAFPNTSGTSNEKIVWLTPQEAVRAFNTGNPALLKNKLKRLTAPLWKRWQKDDPNINLASGWFAINSPLKEPFLGVPLATNAAGERIWILPDDKVYYLKGLLAKLDGFKEKTLPEMTTASGIPAAMQTSGWTVGVLFKVSHNRVDLTMAGYNLAPLNGQTALTASLQPACRIQITNGEAIVLSGKIGGTSNGGVYVFIISPRLIDAAGRLIEVK